MPLLSPARAGIVKTAPRILRGGLLLLVLDLRKDSDEVSLRAGKDRDESAKRSRDRSDDLGDKLVLRGKIRESEDLLLVENLLSSEDGALDDEGFVALLLRKVAHSLGDGGRVPVRNDVPVGSEVVLGGLHHSALLESDAHEGVLGNLHFAARLADEPADLADLFDRKAAVLDDDDGVALLQSLAEHIDVFAFSLCRHIRFHLLQNKLDRNAAQPASGYKKRPPNSRARKP